MAERFTRKSGFLAKVEAVAGVAEATLGASDAILFTKPPTFNIKAVNVPRALALPWMGASEELVGTRRAELKFTTEMVGSGTPGTPPAWGKLLRAAGFAETIVAGQRVEYALINDGFETITGRFYRDGVRYGARGGRGNLKFLFNAGEVPVIECDFWLFDAAALAASIPAVDLSNHITPQVVNDLSSGDILLGATLATGALTGGTALKSNGITWDLGNKLDHRILLGGDSIRITDREVTGQTTVELSAADEITWRDEINANTLTSVGFRHGTVAGKQIVAFAPRVQRTNPQAIDDNGNIMIQSDLRALPGMAGAPELVIVVK